MMCQPKRLAVFSPFCLPVIFLLADNLTFSSAFHPSQIPVCSSRRSFALPKSLNAAHYRYSSSLYASRIGKDVGNASAQSEMERAARHLERLNRRSAPSSAAATNIDQEDDPYAAERQSLFQELRMRPANDLKTELKSLHLKSTGRKPDLAQRLADYYIAKKHAEAARVVHGDDDDDGGDEEIDTVPAQEVGSSEGDTESKALIPLKKFSGLAELSAAAGTALARAQFTKPSPIQAAAIPTLARGRNCILHAETGSGKTLAFLLPITELLWKEAEAGMMHPIEDGGGYAIILTPTRELAAQVAGVATVLAPPGSVRLISQPTNLLRAGNAEKERGEAKYGGRPTDTADAASSKAAAHPRLLIGSAKAIMTSLFGNKKMPAPPTSKPEAKLLLNNVRWLVMDEVDRLLNVKKSRSEKAYKKHEKPAAILTSAVARYTLGKAQIVAASATVGRPLRRELARVLGLPSQECPPVIRGEAVINEDDGSAPKAKAASRFGDITGDGSGEAQLGRLVTIPPTVQHYVVPSMGDSDGQLLTTAANIIKNLPKPSGEDRARRILLVLSKGCELSVRNTLGALQHLQCEPEPRALIDVLEADGTDRMIEVHRKVSGATGVGQSDKMNGASIAQEGDDSSDEGYLLVTGEDSVRGLHLDNLDTVICVGRPRGPDEYTHIAGRTGRAGQKGTVINVVSYEQATALTSWEKMLDVDFLPLDEEEVSSLR